MIWNHIHLFSFSYIISEPRSTEALWFYVQEITRWYHGRSHEGTRMVPSLPSYIFFTQKIEVILVSSKDISGDLDLNQNLFLISFTRFDLRLVALMQWQELSWLEEGETESRREFGFYFYFCFILILLPSSPHHLQ